MKGIGPIVTGLVATLAMGGVIAAFASNSSPYVTVAQAKASRDDRLHLSGKLVPGSVRTDIIRHVLRFALVDADGARVEVVHRGDRPASLTEATKVVAVGGMKDGAFHSDKLIVKCPSKYEEEEKNGNR